jgi:hypothetical protein
MTLLRVVTVFGRVVLLVVLVASGGYVLLYLWRWEWERAQIAGIFFLASLIVMSTQLVLRRIAALSATGPAPGTEHEAPSPVAPPRPFAWTEPDQSTYIFLPVLLGFGVALSVIAAAAERIVAFVVGVPTAGRRPGGRTVPQWVLAVTLTAVLVGTVGLVAVARHRLMTQEEAEIPGVRTYLLEVEGRRSPVDVAVSVDTLAQYCRDRAHVGALTVTDVSVTSDDTAELVVQPILGRFGAARFEGCLTDAVLDRRIVNVLDVRTDPFDDELTEDDLTGSATASAG